MVGKCMVVFADLWNQVHMVMLDLEAAHCLQVLRVLADVPHVQRLLLGMRMVALKIQLL